MLEALREVLAGLELTPLALALLVLAAGVEYVFPPFPGDTVVLMGAFLVGARGWSAPAVYAAVTLGSLLGMAMNHRFGAFVRSRDLAWRARRGWWSRVAARIDPVLPHFSRHAAWYLLGNRFLPSIRALLFVAAGMAGVRWWRVMVFGGASALAWNAMLLAAGAAVGDNWERLAELATDYNRAVWFLFAALGASLLVWIGLRRRKG